MYPQDKAWEASFQGQVIRILIPLMPQLAELSIAPDKLDKAYATDFTLTLKGGMIAVRLRRPCYDFRDLTIRARRDTGMETELAKIRKGYASRYFYGWTNNIRVIAEWILADLDKVRETGLLEKKRRLIPNKDKDGKPDGTYFIGIPVEELREAGCLLAEHLNSQPTPPRIVNTQASPIEGVKRASKRNYVNPYDLYDGNLWD